MSIVIAAMTVMLTVAPAPAARASTQTHKIAPRDDARNNPELATIRQQIRQAIAARDPQLLLPVLGPQVHVSEETSVPRAEVPRVIAAWDRARQVAFWRDLHDAMDLGFAVKDEYAYAPHLFVTLEAYEDEMAIVASGVRLRAEPNLQAAVVAVLSYDVVRFDQTKGRRERAVEIDGYPYDWYPIVTPSGASGWIPQKYARWATSPTFVFTRIRHHWKLTSFVVAD